MKVKMEQMTYQKIFKLESSHSLQSKELVHIIPLYVF